MNTKPYRYQKEDAHRIEELGGRVLLATEMGLGKSLVSLLWYHLYCQNEPIVIVCPASIKWNWERECSKHFSLFSRVLNGMKPPQRQQLSFDPSVHVTIINYDILGPWIPYLKKLNPTLIIADEVHAIKERRTKRAKNLRKLCEDVPYFIALSGTPLTNRPAELWNILNLLRPDLYGSFIKFAMAHCNPQRKPWGMEYKGAENLDKLHRNMSEHLMIRRRKADVLKDLPAKARHAVLLDLEKPKEYATARDDFVRWLRKQAGTKITSSLRAQMLVKSGHLKRLAARLKLKSVFNWLDDFLEEGESKLIVFGVHHEILDTLHERYSKCSVLITGETIGELRQKRFDKFLRDGRTRLLIGNIQAAGVGWSAKGVSAVAFVEMGWTPAEHSQAEDRVHGIGRGKEGVRSQVWYLVAKDTIETRLCELIQQKQKVLDQVLDGKKIEDGIDIHTQLLNELLKEGAK